MRFQREGNRLGCTKRSTVCETAERKISNAECGEPGVAGTVQRATEAIIVRAATGNEPARKHAERTIEYVKTLVNSGPTECGAVGLRGENKAQSSEGHQPTEPTAVSKERG